MPISHVRYFDIIAGVSALILLDPGLPFEFFKIPYLGTLLSEQLAFNTKALQCIINNILSRKWISCFKEYSF